MAKTTSSPFARMRMPHSFPPVSPRARKIIFITLATLLALFVALCIFVVVFLEDILRGQAGERVSGKIGRSFAIEGPLDVTWTWKGPRIVAEQVRLGNIEGSEDPYMLDIANVDTKIRIWNLLRGRLEMDYLEINNAKLILERADEDTKNWDFPELSSGHVATNAVLPKERGDFPIIDRIRINEGNLIYRDAVKKLNLDLQLSTASGTAQGEDDFFSVNGKGTLQDRPFELEANGGSLQMLRDTSKDFPLTLKVMFNATEATIDGTFRDPVKLTGMDTTMSLKGPNLADLYYLTGIPLPPTPPYSLEGKLAKHDGVWDFVDFAGRVGKSDLNGTVKYDTDRERSLLSGKMHSKLLDVEDLGGFIGMAPTNAAPANLTPEQKKLAATQKAKPTVLPDVSLDISRLRAADIDVTWHADKLVAPGVPLDSFDVGFNLDNGLLKLNPLAFGMAGGRVSGNLTLNGRGDVPATEIDLTISRLSLKQFLKETRFADMSAGLIGGKINLRGTGDSLAKMLGNSNGEIFVAMAGGNISLMIVEAADLDVAQLIPLILGEDKTTEVRCAVGDFKVKNGLLRSDAFVLDTTDTNIQGEADINLKNEEMNIKLNAHPKDPSLLSLKSNIVLRGTMKQPKVGISPIETGLRGAVAVALGAIFPPAAILPFIEAGLGKDSNCAALLNQK